MDDNLWDTITHFFKAGLGVAVFLGTIVGIVLALVFLFEDKIPSNCLTMESELKKALVNNDKQLARSIISENAACFTSSEVIKYIEVLNKKD